MLELTVTIGADWGCEHTADEGSGYAEFVEQCLKRHLPGVNVDVSYDGDHLGRDAIAMSDVETGLEIQEVRELIQECWDDWCSEGWEQFTAA